MPPRRARPGRMPPATSCRRARAPPAPRTVRHPPVSSTSVSESAAQNPADADRAAAPAAPAPAGPPAPADPAEELVYEVDETDTVLRTIRRGDPDRPTLRHRSIAILFRAPDGRVLVHRRARAKRVFPQYYDMFVAGMVPAGESYDEAARREAGEEIGAVDPVLADGGQVPLRRRGRAAVVHPLRGRAQGSGGAAEVRDPVVRPDDRGGIGGGAGGSCRSATTPRPCTGTSTSVSRRLPSRPDFPPSSPRGHAVLTLRPSGAATLKVNLGSAGGAVVQGTDRGNTAHRRRQEPGSLPESRGRGRARAFPESPAPHLRAGVRIRRPAEPIGGSSLATLRDGRLGWSTWQKRRRPPGATANPPAPA